MKIINILRVLILLTIGIVGIGAFSGCAPTDPGRPTQTAQPQVENPTAHTDKPTQEKTPAHTEQPTQENTPALTSQPRDRPNSTQILGGESDFPVPPTNTQTPEIVIQLVSPTSTPNHPPNAMDDQGVTDVDSLLFVEAPGVLANDTDLEEGLLEVISYDSISTRGAAVEVFPDGSYTYDPNTSLELQNQLEGATSMDNFTYLIRDPAGAISSASVRIKVHGRQELMIPLIDLGTQTYQGFEGGLYRNGSNQMPELHALVGLERSAAVQPLNSNGNPDPEGRYIMLSIGMSNTTSEFCGSSQSSTDCRPLSFVGQALDDPEVNKTSLLMVNGARSGQVIQHWIDPNLNNYDLIRDQKLAPLGLSERQVQVIWVKLAVATPVNRSTLPNPDSDALIFMQQMADVMRAFKIRYPNLQQVFISTRIYGGYATTNLNPEPYAYEYGFSIKWLIDAQIRQMETGVVDPVFGDLDYTTVAPWIAWGPYLWANGTESRSDGLVWERGDMAPKDGTHPSETGIRKVGALLLDFFRTSEFTVGWFLEN